MNDMTNKKYVFNGYVHTARADGKRSFVDCDGEGTLEIKSEISLWNLYCHNVRITIEDLGKPKSRKDAP